jgi:hypothetical protein
MSNGKTLALAAGLVFVGASLLLAQSKATPTAKPKATVKTFTPKAAPALAATKPAASTPAAPADNLTVIGHLEMRGKTITLKTGPNGPIYFVKSKDGKVLANDLTLDQLKAQAPEVHDFIKSSVAGAAARKGGVMDASAR